MRYYIPDVPPSNNKFIGRNARWEYQSAKKQWADMIALFCRPKPPEPLKKATVKIKYYFTDRRRRDPDNYSGKMILDGLTKCGIIADDSFFVIDLQLSAEFGADKAQTEIIIE